MIRFDPVLLKYAIGDEVMELPPAEMRVLNVLLHYAGRVVETRDMALLIYGHTSDTNLINVVAGRLRKKIAAIDAQEAARLQNVRGKGYMWSEN